DVREAPPSPPPPKVEPEPPNKEKEKPPPREPLPPRLRENFWTGYRVSGVGLASVGVAALGAGIILGTSANGAKDAYNAGPTRAAFDPASSLETWTNVALIGGAALLAGGITLIVLPLGERSDDGVQIGAAPGGMSVGGSY